MRTYAGLVHSFLRRKGDRRELGNEPAVARGSRLERPKFRAARGMLPDNRRAVIETTGYLVPGVTTDRRAGEDDARVDRGAPCDALRETNGLACGRQFVRSRERRSDPAFPAGSTPAQLDNVYRRDRGAGSASLESAPSSAIGAIVLRRGLFASAGRTSAAGGRASGAFWPEPGESQTFGGKDAAGASDHTARARRRRFQNGVCLDEVQILRHGVDLVGIVAIRKATLSATKSSRQGSLPGSRMRPARIVSTCLNSLEGFVTLSECEAQGATILHTSGDGDRCVAPSGHGRCTKCSVRGGRCQMALDVERVVCGCMAGEKSLGRSDTLESLHLALSSSGRLM